MRRWWPLLAVALLLGALSPFASSLPDGLESVAKGLGFAHRAAPALIPAPLPDYSLPRHPGSRALVGILGTGAVFALAYGFGRLAARRRETP